MGIFHQYISTIADGGDTDLVRPSDWNAVHTGVNEHTHTTSDTGGFISIRDVLTGDRTYYVSTDGSDTDNTGLTTDAPFATPQHAMDVISTLDFNGIYTVTMKLGDGYYSVEGETPVINIIKCVGQSSLENLVIEGNVDDPEACELDGFWGIKMNENSAATIRGVKLTGGESGMYSYYGVFMLDFIYFGTCGDACVALTGGFGGFNSADVEAESANIVIGDGSGVFITADNQATFEIFDTWVDGASTDTTYGFDTFVEVIRGAGLNSDGASFDGTYTGTRYFVATNAYIDTGGGGAEYFPGDAVGETETGGEYA